MSVLQQTARNSKRFDRTGLAGMPVHRKAAQTLKALFRDEGAALSFEFFFVMNVALVPIILMTIEVTEYARAQGHLKTATSTVADLVSRYDVFDQIPTTDVMNAARAVLPRGVSQRVSIRILTGEMQADGRLMIQQSAISNMTDTSKLICADNPNFCGIQFTNLSHGDMINMPTEAGAVPVGQQLIIAEVFYAHDLISLPFSEVEFQVYQDFNDARDEVFVLRDRFFTPPREGITAYFDANGACPGGDASCNPPF